MPSLPQDSPASGLGTGFPMVRGPPSELRDFYVTTYQAAFGKRPTGTPQKLKEGRVSGIEPPGDGSIRPLLGVHTGSGYVVNNYSSLRSLISPHVERHDTDVSTTSEDFKVFGRPDYQRMLPEHVDEPQCPYPTGFSFSRLRFGEVKAPKASGEYGTQSHCASPAKPDVPARVTELSGCTGTAPRSDLTLPEQPLGVGGGRMDSFPGSTPAMGQPAPFAPPELRVGPRGVIAVKKPLAYSTVHNKFLNKLSPLAPVAPGWWAQPPITWAPRSVEGIQIPSPSGFSTNNRPTILWRIDDPLT
ncbi:uncharacterized protein LOC121339955 isoform X6 [Onychostruthus taczanowskii]|uniref:uncharacterized protein LOC121339955 isoform X6 n=1 Tax=Onychostruthus taczanowskii TaxID=356909 RepID=UPI001B804666|nr:uncharacterized protein LOC121339955 isoform X6 [Onychostruthus taczanowskii]